MARFELRLPKMGESVAEATITNWLKNVGDTIDMDEPVLEIATDKVDSEVPSEVSGTLVEQLFSVDDVVEVGAVLAVIETDQASAADQDPATQQTPQSQANPAPEVSPEVLEAVSQPLAQSSEANESKVSSSEGRFYSPLVRNIAQQEGISQQELDELSGSGKDGRVTKSDILAYVAQRSSGAIAPIVSALPTTASASSTAPQATPVQGQLSAVAAPKQHETTVKPQALPLQQGDEIIEMTRMGKLIAHHMTASVSTSAHVQSFVECDVTKIWQWRERVKKSYEAREGEKLTFTPIFMEAVARALKDFPMMNISVDGDKIIKHRSINLGMAAALDDGNLIVPVIKNADQLNLVGMSKAVNDLAQRARANKLKPEEITGGTYTVTNVGNFGSIMGTPIINQPQVGILALGAIRKVPAVIETSEGDFIGIRYKMYLSHSYDHRVVNGALGGMFAKRVADYLEAWDTQREA
jgi:2-oxoglutarate dehydrogenase E2 component (dihydrolipoamide succinyltransferase)